MEEFARGVAHSLGDDLHNGLSANHRLLNLLDHFWVRLRVSKWVR